MEARRLSRQRRDSAKISAALTLPSTQEQDFHLRLIDLYGQHACLWDTSLSEYENVELKRRAWESIAKQLGSHLTPAFVKSRISSLRHRLNVYKLQAIEFQMCPGGGKQPEKLYYIDRFAFLDTIRTQPEQKEQKKQQQKSEQGLDAESAGGGGGLHTLRSGLSIANMVKQRLAQQTMPLGLRRMTFYKSETDSGRDKSSSSSCPDQRSSMLGLPPTPPSLRAEPGESVSKTKIIKTKPIPSADAEHRQEQIQSEEEELYRLHWNVRQQTRTRRPSRLSTPEMRPPPAPPLPKGIRLSKSKDSATNII